MSCQTRGLVMRITLVFCFFDPLLSVFDLLTRVRNETYFGPLITLSPPWFRFSWIFQDGVRRADWVWGNVYCIVIDAW